jgi:hypothetical protein
MKPFRMTILTLILCVLAHVAIAQPALKQVYLLEDFAGRGYSTNGARMHFKELANGKKYVVKESDFALIDNAIKHAKKKKVMQHKMASGNRLFSHFIYDDTTVHEVIIFYNAIENLSTKKIYWVDDKATQAEMKQMINRIGETYSNRK